MADRTRIEWADATWNPVVGCSPVSDGCVHCYARRMAQRFGGYGDAAAWDGTMHYSESNLDIPFHWRKPRRIFVCSMGDLFHPNVPDEWRDRVFAVMALCPQHRFYVLTKRAERMRDYIHRLARSIAPLETVARDIGYTFKFQDPDTGRDCSTLPWPLPNVRLGVTVENQARADERIPVLLDTPAAGRFLSVEPMLGPVDLDGWICGNGCEDWGECHGRSRDDCCASRIDEVFVGCERGPGARPCPPAWVRGVVEQCRDAGVAVLVKAVRANDDGTGKILRGDALPEWAHRAAVVG